MTKKHKASRALEILIEITICLIICAGVMVKLHASSTSLRVNETIARINNTLYKAYKTSRDLDETNTPTFQLDRGISIVNDNNAWYMICDLHEITNGNTTEQEIIMKKIAQHENFSLTDNDNCISMFLRFSSL